MEIAAWWPCSTAQMMFFGPNAASPPKNTSGGVDWKVTLSTTGTSHLSNSMPRSRSIQGKAFSWPMARITSSHGRNSSPSDALGRDAAALELVLHLLEQHAGEPAVLDDERLGRAVDDDLDALLLGVLELPGRGLEEAARLARHDLHALRAETQDGAAAVHRGVADADDEHALADLLDVAEGDRLEPGDADVDAVALVAARQLELLALRSAGADEHRVEASASSSARMLSTGRVQPQVHAHADDHRRSPRRAPAPAGGTRGCWCASGRRATANCSKIVTS